MDTPIGSVARRCRVPIAIFDEPLGEGAGVHQR